MSDHEKPTAEHKHSADYPETAPDAHDADEPPHHGMSVGEYMATRFSSLKPPMTKLPNPFKLIMQLNKRQWAFFLVAFFAWVRMLLWLTSAAPPPPRTDPPCVSPNWNTDRFCRPGMPSISSPSLLQSTSCLRRLARPTLRSHGV